MQFNVLNLGSIEGQQRSPNEIIDAIDAAKKTGRVAWRGRLDDEVHLVLSKYGLKMTDKNNHQIFMRVVMHKIGFVLHYVEDSNENIVVIETGEADKPHAFKYYVFQADTAEHATEICDTISQAFEVVFAKSTLEAAAQ